MTTDLQARLQCLPSYLDEHAVQLEKRDLEATAKQVRDWSKAIEESADEIARLTERNDELELFQAECALGMADMESRMKDADALAKAVEEMLDGELSTQVGVLLKVTAALTDYQGDGK